MEKTGYFIIEIKGKQGQIELKPETFDIRDLREVLDQVEDLLFPSEKKERPLISYEMQEGSVVNKFKTSMQHIIGLNAVLGSVAMQSNIDFLDAQTAQAFEIFQQKAVKKEWVFNLLTSLPDTNQVTIDRSSQFLLNEKIWVEAEFYFYGEIKNAGGVKKSNFHLSTEEYGTLIINTEHDFIANLKENVVYRFYGVRAMGKQNIETGEIMTSSLKLVDDFVDYDPDYNKKYLEDLRDKAKGWLQQIDPDEWLKEIRGGYDA